MADLLDIAPATACEVIKVDGGKEITVRGLHGNAIASIVGRFPDILAPLLSGSIGIGGIAKLGDAIGPVIAAGCGHLGDIEREKRADVLLFEDQTKLIIAILKLTFPNGCGSLIEAMMTLNLGAVDESKLIKVRLRKSPPPSPPSSDADSRQNLQ